MVEYFTQDYYDELVDTLNGDEDFKDETEGFSTSVVQVAQDRGEAFKITIDDGQVSAEAVDPDADADFRFIADYDDWAKVVTGEASAEKLIMTGSMQIDGSMGEVLKHRDKLEYLTATGREISPDV